MSETVQPDILHLEACNFVDNPVGGQLSFSRQLIKALGNRLALVGWASSYEEPVGCWFNKVIDGTVYRYFAIRRERPPTSRPLIPARLTTWFEIRRYLGRILTIDIPNIILSEHAILLAMHLQAGYNVCYRFPGVESPLSISRYPWAEIFAGLFDRLFWHALQQKVNCILAAADESSIADLRRRAGEFLRGKTIISYPTRVDTDIFHSADGPAVRKRLGLPADAVIVVTASRIHWAKGWPFLLESFRRFQNNHPDSLLFFLGDGAEREALMKKAAALGLQHNVIIVGYQPSSVIASYLQSSDLFIMGSLKEGWSTVLVEALACHVPIVTTRFSSADTIVRHGVNGFVTERDPAVFSAAMESALNLVDVAVYAESVMDRYALKNLGKDLASAWPLSRRSVNPQEAAG